MTLLQSLLHITNFQTPLLQTLVPCVSAAYAIQAAFALPSIAARSERAYDLSGALTFLSVLGLSIYLPALRASLASGAGAGLWRQHLQLHWRQVLITGAVGVWSVRLGSYLFRRILAEGKDSRFDSFRGRPGKFFAVWMAQAAWVAVCSLPVVAVNAAPAAALALAGGVGVADVLGFGLYGAGLAVEVVADRQKERWLRQRREKVHDEAFMTKGLWARCRYPNYFGETTLWTGVAIAAAGVLVTSPVRLAIGLGGGVAGQLAVLGLAFASPAFTAFLLLKVSGVPLSERKYDRRYGDRKDYREWKERTPLFFPKLF